MEQREIDNMLLSMIQKHFPSLPLSDEHTDWGKWLGFARAVYESGRASPASAPEGWKLVPVEPTHAILDVMFDAGIDRHDGDLTTLYRAMLGSAPTPPVSECVDPVMTKEELIAAAESIGMRFPGASIPPVSEDRWLPIETAPKDEFVLLAGPSGYTTIETVFSTGRMCSDYHVGSWIDHANDDLTDWGFEPTHWMPLPKAPAMQEDKP